MKKVFKIPRFEFVCWVSINNEGLDNSEYEIRKHSIKLINRVAKKGDEVKILFYQDDEVNLQVYTV